MKTINNSDRSVQTILHPDPILAAAGLSLDSPMRFWHYVNVLPIGCWQWTGDKNNSGGRMTRLGIRNDSRISAMRVAWMMTQGRLPPEYIWYACPNHTDLCTSHIKVTGPTGEFVALNATDRFKRLCNQSGQPFQIIDSLHPRHFPTPQWMIDQGFSESFAYRFAQRIDKSSPNGCWIWTGATSTNKFDDKGYGSIGAGGIDGKQIRANRAAWMLYNGPIPEGMEVCHNCPGSTGEPRCCNPAHLFLGTHAENMADLVSKRKWAWDTANRHAKAFAEVAAQVGVSAELVQRIVEAYRHVSSE